MGLPCLELRDRAAGEILAVIAQSVERSFRKAEVAGSIPADSTMKFMPLKHWPVMRRLCKARSSVQIRAGAPGRRSSDGRASPWYWEGCAFDPRRWHHSTRAWLHWKLAHLAGSDPVALGVRVSPLAPASSPWRNVDAPFSNSGAFWRARSILAGDTSRPAEVVAHLDRPNHEPRWSAING